VGPGPGPQVHLDVGIASGHDQPLARGEAPQGPAEEEVPAAVEADAAEGHFGKGALVRAQGRYPSAVTWPAAS
jgi:hypothetical protein